MAEVSLGIRPQGGSQSSDSCCLGNELRAVWKGLKSIVGEPKERDKVDAAPVEGQQQEEGHLPTPW